MNQPENNPRIRSTAKAIILHEGKLLLNRCQDACYGPYYSLPGGGQNQYEPLHNALARECLEETGYLIRPLRLAAVCEAICLEEAFRIAKYEYAHKMYHIFLCELANIQKRTPTLQDEAQLRCEWVAADSINLPLFPRLVSNCLPAILEGTAPFYLGAEWVAKNHG